MSPCLRSGATRSCPREDFTSEADLEVACKSTGSFRFPRPTRRLFPTRYLAPQELSGFRATSFSRLAFAVLLTALIAGTAAKSVASAQTTAPKSAVLTSNSDLAAIPGGFRPTTDADLGHFSSEKMTVEVVLAPANEPDLNDTLVKLYDTTSPSYHQWLGTGESTRASLRVPRRLQPSRTISRPMDWWWNPLPPLPCARQRTEQQRRRGIRDHPPQLPRSAGDRVLFQRLGNPDAYEPGRRSARRDRARESDLRPRPVSKLPASNPSPLSLSPSCELPYPSEELLFTLINNGEIGELGPVGTVIGGSAAVDAARLRPGSCSIFPEPAVGAPRPGGAA